MNAAIQSSAELIDLTCSDWEGTRRVELKSVALSSTVGQVVSEATEHLGLPFEHLYQAFLRGRELDPADTLEDLKIGTDACIDLVPEVTAG